jgi:hypothetical protein
MSSRASARVQARSVRLRNEQIRALSDFNWFDRKIVAAKLHRVISATMKTVVRKQIVKKAATILEDHLGSSNVLDAGPHVLSSPRLICPRRPRDRKYRSVCCEEMLRNLTRFCPSHRLNCAANNTCR